MLHTYVLTAIRYLRKHRFYATINIVGLGIGLAACLLIMVYIRHELRYDAFHTNAERIVRATMEFRMADEVNQVATTGTKLGPESQRKFPEVETYVRTFITSGVLEVNDQAQEESGIMYADKDFFNVFSFDLLDGQKTTVLDAPDKMVVTVSTAKRLFGTTQALGKVIKMGKATYQVSGVCADPPAHSQLKFGMVTDFLNLGTNATQEQWWTANWITYLMLNPGTDIPTFESKLNAYMRNEAVRTEARLEGESYLMFHLQPIKQVHLYSTLEGHEPNGSIKYLYMFGMVALLILLIACANYTNLATAQSAGRASEMGMRKAMGAGRRDLFWQFIGESTAIALLSGILAFGLAWLALPALNHITGQDFQLHHLLDPILVGALLVLLFVVGFISGAYPAIVLSGMRALQVMKSHFIPGTANLVVRRSLIVLQFAVSVFLVIYTLIMLQQMEFMKNKHLGYQKDQVMSLPVDGRMHDQYEVLKTSLAQLPGVVSVSGAYETPEYVLWGDGITATDEKGQHNISVNAMPVDIDFLETMKMQLLAGRDFGVSDLFEKNQKKEKGGSSNAYILNESLVRKIGWTPEEAIGKRISKGIEGPVVGVVSDFHFRSLHQEVTPLVMFLEPDFVRQFVVRVDATNMSTTIKSIEDWWKQRVVHRPFSFSFLDESYSRLYKAEERTSVLFISVSVLAILLACLGLFGLASFAVVQRTREIGIRRVLGAGSLNIVWMVARSFLLLVGIGICIAIPAGWTLGRQWLNDFAYRVDPSVWNLILAGVLALLVALITISIQSLKAAFNNPVKSLRTE